jgi:general secretion pathway protein G
MCTRRGFTLFELILVICLIGIFAAIALERLTRYQELAEKTAMERTVGALRSALALRLASYALGGRLAQAPELAQQNPMDWLAERPGNYVGELYDPLDADVTGGSWYFDRKTRELVYRPRMTRFFQPSADGRYEVRYAAVVRLGEAPGAQREVSQLTIRPTRPYQWAPVW